MTRPEEPIAVRQLQLVVFSAVVQGLYYLRGVLLLPILTRCLGMELFGVWTKMQALANMLTALLGFGVVAGFNRFLPSASEGDRASFFWGTVAAVAGSGILFGGLLVGGRPWLAGVLCQGEPAVVTSSVLLGLAGVATAMGFAQVTASFYQGTGRVTLYGITIAGQVIGLLATALLAWWLLDRSLWVPISAWSAGVGTVVLITSLVICRTSGITVNPARIWTMARFGAPLLPVASLQWITDFADRYLLTWLVPSGADELVGTYGAHYALGSVVTMVFAPFFVFYTPAAYRLWDQGRVADVGALTRQTAKLAATVAVPVVLGGVVLGAPGVGLIGGAACHRDPVVVVLVMAGYCLYMLGAFVQMPLLLQQRSRTVLGIAGLVAASNLLACCTLIPLGGELGGMRGAAAGTVASFGVFLLASAWATRGVPGHGLAVRDLAVMTATAVGWAVLAWPWLPDGPGGRIAWLLLVTSLYAVGLVWSGTICREELVVIKEAVQALWRRVRGPGGPGDRGGFGTVG